MTSRVHLTRSVIVASAEQPPYLILGVQELAEYLQEITGRAVAVKNTLASGAEVQIIVGEENVRRLAPEIWEEQSPGLGAEGFLIRAVARGGQTWLLVTGATPQGTKYGLVDLMKRIGVTGRSAHLPRRIKLTSVPSFAVRGMHLNGWAFNYPYTFRCWKEADWQRYIDMLVYQGANLLFLWPFMEILPLPLSPADRSYLHEVRRVVDYARTQRGLDVWVMQSANRVARNDCGIRDPRQRPYWMMNATGQMDLDPADPKQFQRIMKSREALYRIVNNADGYVTIDSDPGGWPQSPLGNYLKIFQASRQILDRTNVHGRGAKLVNWLWSGWGRGYSADQRPTDIIHATIRAMKQELPEPWGLIAGKREYLPVCQAEGVLPQTVYLPYNVIEGEPSRPRTQHEFPLLREHLEEVDRYPGLAGLMGNVQTPLLQFPHVAQFLASAWDTAARRRGPRVVLRDLAGCVYPEKQDLLVDAWMALAPSARASAGMLARRLKRSRLGRPGILGRKLFPSHRQIAEDLVWQLEAWAAFAALRRVVTSRAAKARCAAQVAAFLDAALAWDARHGWSRYWRQLGRPWDVSPNHERAYAEIIARLRAKLGGDHVTERVVTAFLAPIGRRLARKHDAWIVGHCAIEPFQKALLKSSSQRSAPQ